MSKKQVKFSDQKGSALLLLVLCIAAIALTAFYTTTGMMNHVSVRSRLTWSQLQANESARSAVMVLEQALKRRLWEPPADENCLKAMSFGVKGSIEGIEFTTDAEINLESESMVLVGSAVVKGATASMVKHLKSFDIGDMLIYSASKEPSRFSKHLSDRPGISILGQDKMIYLEGPLELSNMNHGGSNSTDFSGGRSVGLPNEIGLIIQSQRMYLLGGVRHAHARPVPPDIITPVVKDSLAPYVNMWTAESSGATIFTKDYELAKKLRDRIQNEQTWTGDLNPLLNGVYPYAMGGSSIPVMLESATDNGTYYNNLSQSPIMYFSYGANFGWLSNTGCLYPTPINKYCSDSLEFPNTFSRWRQDAGLENVMVTESKLLETAELSWENFDSLKEDAKMCGLVLTPSSPSRSRFEDCDLTDSVRVDAYVKRGENPCGTYTQSDLSEWGSQFPRFSVGDYESLKDPTRALRRVIYADSDIELAQVNPRGLWQSLPAKAREVLPIWVVNEAKTQLRPYQPNSAPVIPSEPPRELFFNQDTTPSSSLPGLKLVMVNRNPMPVVSHHHQAMTFADVQGLYPRVNNSIQARADISTDAARQENDGFRYGVRQVHISDVAVITGQDVPFSETFFLRGLWWGIDSSASQYPRNACIFAGPTGTPVMDGLSWGTTPRPSHAGTTNPYLPPPGSRFYQPGNLISPRFVPAIFHDMAVAQSLIQSSLTMSGRRITMRFSKEDIPSKGKPLSTRTYYPWEVYKADWQEKRATWPAGGTYFHPTTSSGRRCNDLWRYANNNTPDTSVNIVYLNRGGYKFSLSTSEEQNDYLGSIMLSHESIMEVHQ